MTQTRRALAIVGVLTLVATGCPVDDDAASDDTAAPPDTEAPPATDAPGDTAAPPDTDAPPETEAPPETDAPVETEAPPETDAPPETEAPPETDPTPATDPPADQVDCETDATPFDGSGEGLDPRVTLVGFTVVQTTDDGNIWLVLCWDGSWAQMAPIDLFSSFFGLAIGPTGNAAQVFWEYHDGVPAFGGETASGPFPPVFLLGADGRSVAVFSGLSSSGPVDGQLLFSAASWPEGATEPVRTSGDAPIVDADVRRFPSIGAAFPNVPAPAETHPGFDVDGADPG